MVPLINIVKVPTPLALAAGPGLVTYNYTVSNVGGPQPLVNIGVVDDTCSPVVLLSGDTNADTKLQVGENWKYSCSMTLSKTTTNNVVATGHSDDGFNDIAVATALATVVLTPGLPNTGLLPPLINIIKVPSRLTPFPFGGGSVTYTYTVTNPGVVAMNGVTVTDDKCSPVVWTGGDTNGDSLLDSTETWTYTCTTNVSVSTRNIATALGRANGFIALGYAFSTVLVSAPALPNTGVSPGASIAPSLWLTLDNPPQPLFYLTIPSITVDAEVGDVGLTSEGAVGAPTDPARAAWFNLGPRPGEAGVAVIDGHFGWKDAVPAVFDHLADVQKGEKIYVKDASGVSTTFVVRTIKTYGASGDASDVFASNDTHAHLVLITCGGIWDATQKSYSERVVVFADKE